MKIDRYVLELPEHPVVSASAAEHIVEEVVRMTAEANIGLARETIVSISREHGITLKDLEMFIDRFLTIMYNTNVFTRINQVVHPLSDVDVEVVHRSAKVEITWNDRINKDRP
jgi:type III secretion system FlhB-like substrate exporter